jgi:MinD-like ATPase involved in chromosome partitioning or flagellar assembly
LATEPETAGAILSKNRIEWVVAYDADRTEANSAAILGMSPSQNSLGRLLDRAPSQAPPFLQVAAQNPVAKLFRVHFFQEK